MSTHKDDDRGKRQRGWDKAREGAKAAGRERAKDNEVGRWLHEWVGHTVDCEQCRAVSDAFFTEQPEPVAGLCGVGRGILLKLKALRN